MFVNKIINANNTDVLKIIKSTPDDIHIVDIDGENIQTWEEYALTIESKMCFPSTAVEVIARYEDWICDLEWLGKRGYLIIIRNYSKFLKDDPDMRNFILVLQDINNQSYIMKRN